MPDPVIDGTTAPIATPPAPVPPVVADPPKPAVPASVMPEDALKQRLDAAKATGQKELLAKLGLASEDELAAAIAAHKATTEAAKSEQQKAVERETALAQAKTTIETYRVAIESTWQAESTKLTAEQLAAVTAIAGEDVAMRVRTLNALRPTWATATAVATPAASPPVAPANSAPAAGAPAPAGTVSPPDIKAYHAALKAKNPIAAAEFGRQNPSVYG